MFSNHNRSVASGLAVLSFIALGGPLANAQSIDDFVDGGTFVFSSDGGASDLLGGAADGEVTNVVCIADGASSLGGFASVQFIDVATGAIASLGVTQEECAIEANDEGDDQADDDEIVVDPPTGNDNLNAIQKGNYADHLVGAFFSQPIGPLSGQPLIPSGRRSPFIKALKALCVSRVEEVQARLDEERTKLTPIDARIAQLQSDIASAEETRANAAVGLNDLVSSGVVVDSNLVSAALADPEGFEIAILKGRLQVLENLKAVDDIRGVAAAAKNEINTQIAAINKVVGAAKVSPAATLLKLKARVGLVVGGGAAAFLVEAGINNIADREKKALVDDFLPILDRFQAAFLQAQINAANGVASESEAELGELQLERAVIENRTLQLEDELQREKDRCPAVFQQNAEVSPQFARTKAKAPRRQSVSSISKSVPISVDLDSTAVSQSGAVAMTSLINGRPWTFSISAGASGLRDDRAGADLRSDMYAVTAAASVDLGQTVIGFGAGFTTGEVTSDDLQSELDGDYFTVGLSARRQFGQAFSIAGTLSYSRGSNDISIVGDSGSFNVDALSASANISTAIPMSAWTLSPTAGFGLTKVWREGYADSAGDDIPSTSFLSGSLSGGVIASRTFTGADRGWTVSPSLGLFGGYSFNDQDAAFATGGRAEDNAFGASLVAGLEFDLKGGATGSLNGSYGLFTENVSQWSLGAQISIPLN